jgi:ATP-dependent exoDNAse (exonuclease V) beta subunit
VADLLKLFLDQTNYLAALRLAGQTRALRNVAKLLADVHTSELVNVTDFLVFAGTLKDSGSREGEARSSAGGVVQIMSIHQAKGLEFPVVVLGDAASGGSNRSSPVLIDPLLGVLLENKAEDGQKAAVYELGKQLNEEQEAAESNRLLYVALTRAEQILMVSGHGISTKAGKMSLKGWLGQLANITGLSNCELDDYNGTGDRRLVYSLAVEDTVVNATLYEPNYQSFFSQPQQKPKVIEAEALARVHQNLNKVIIKPGPEPVERETPERVWQVVPTAVRPQAPAWLIGTLIHEAIALWRFPDPTFDKWVESRAGSRGLIDRIQVDDAIKETKRLLTRFQGWDLFSEIESDKQRFHELPFSYDIGYKIETGFIDLLYRQNGRWTIIDFKTDEIRDEAEVNQLLKKEKYEEQIKRYGQAVSRMTGERPQLLICLLNGPNGIIIKRVQSQE